MRSLLVVIFCLVLAAAFTFNAVYGQSSDESRIPVIAVTNYGGPNAEALEASWNSFQTNWPDRTFCVLRLLGASDLLMPLSMATDPKVMSANIRRDYGNSFAQSDWFDLCNLSTNPTSQVALLISLSNDVLNDRQEQFDRIVSASTQYLADRLDRAGQQSPPIRVDARDDGNWIEPLDSLGTPPTPKPTPRPTNSPTRRPTRLPTRLPTNSPTRRPTRRPTNSPTRRPTRPPTPQPTPATRTPTPLPTPQPTPTPTPATIVDLVVGRNDLSALVDLVILAGLDQTVAGQGPFTVFAPTNDAFAALPPELVATLTGDPTGALTDVLLYHVLPAQVLSSDLVNGAMVTTVNGATVEVSLTNGVMINDANVVEADLLAGNGVVHIIDKVLIPVVPTIVDLVVNRDELLTLVQLVSLAGLVDTLLGEGPFTVFAPTDDAFAALPDELVTSLINDPTGALTDVLLYHVVAGEILSTDLVDGALVETINGANVVVTLGDGVMINDANVIVPDLIAGNGVVHIIDTVLIPPVSNIVDLVVARGELSTLVELVTLAGLVDALRGEGPFTLFAPTNNAIAALPPELVTSLTADPTGALNNVLLYHVVAGAVLSSDLVDGASVETANGESVVVTLSDVVMINDATVIEADLIAGNGVVHIIDKVLIPSALRPGAYPEVQQKPKEGGNGEYDIFQ